MNIGIIGLGFMGGSLAKSLRRVDSVNKIVAFDIDEKSLIKAKEDKNISEYTLNIDETFEDLDIIFICTPVSIISKIAKKLKSVIKETAIITDIGSTKKSTLEEMKNIDIKFVGGHPMVGSERTGYETSKDFLFENSYYILTQKEDNKKEVEILKNLLLKIKAIPIIIDESEHDYITSVISHIPHIIAASLVHLVKDLDSKDEIMKTLAAGGFKDITRIASSDPTMWENICHENKENIINNLDRLIEILFEFKKSINNRDKIYKYFEESRDYRNSFANNKINGKSLPSINIGIKDETGAIAKIAKILSDNEINIRNIEVVNNRENMTGALKVVVENYIQQEKAYKVLKIHKYDVSIIN